MADAIHEISSGQTFTLEDIAAQYYAVRRPGGELDPGRTARVTQAIRVRTGSSLDALADDESIPIGTVLKVPTLREIPRAILTDDATLKADLEAAGYDHANKLLRRPVASVVELLGPYTGTPYDAADVTRAYALTAFFDFDGMDRRTAIHLHDTASINSITELASQSEATIQGILDALVPPKGTRPAALATQGHAARWRTSAVIHRRNRFSKRVKRQPFQIPFPSKQAIARAEHYEEISYGSGQISHNRTLARRLALLHRFQANVIDGNFYALSKRWDRAAASHMTARKLFHRLAEDLGAASNVNDDVGFGLDVAINTAYRMLKEIPPDNETPLGAPRLRATFDDSTRPYRLESDASAQDGKSVLLPAPDPAAPPVKVRLNATSFTTDYKVDFLNPQLSGTPTGSVQLRTGPEDWRGSAGLGRLGWLLPGRGELGAAPRPNRVGADRLPHPNR